MSVSNDLAPVIPAARDADAAFAGWLQRPRLALALLAIAVLQQCLGHHNGDNSWLFTVCEKILDGARPYADVIETNPPASFMIYMPAALLARVLGLPVEPVASAFVFAGALACIFFAGAILRGAGLLRATEAGFALNVSVFALVLLPGFSFAEREHIAAFAILPALALYAARAGGAPVKLSHALFGGLLAGFVMAIKPHFALAVALPILAMIVVRRSLRPAFGVENFVAAAVVIAYAAAVFAFFPAFFDVLPSIVDAYVPVMEPWRILLAHPWFLANLLILIVMAGFGGARCRDPRVMMLAAASLGFVATFVLQGKGWVNHGAPGVSLAIIAIALVAAPALREIAERRPGGEWTALRPMILFVMLPLALSLPLLFGALAQFMRAEEYPGLRELVRQHAPPRPKLIALSGDLDVGHPLTRRVDGVWVGQPHSLWLMLSAQLLIDNKRGDAERLRAYVDADALMFAANVRDRRPDLILVTVNDRTKLMAAHPAIAGVMANYARIAAASEVEVWAPVAAR